MKVIVVNMKTGEDYDVYVGRAGHGHDGYFGNPFRIEIDTPEARAEALVQYQHWFYNRLAKDPEFKSRVDALKNYAKPSPSVPDLVLRLGCFCKPKACHGDIIAEYLESNHDGSY